MTVRSDKIVIIGGGFAGLHLAKILRHTTYQVLLVDRENHHMFQPLFYQVATARLEPSNISFPFRKIFQSASNVEFLMTQVHKILPEEKTIQTTNGPVYFDYLVIASGCKTNFFGNQQLSDHAFSMKSTQEAIDIRNEILLTFEKFISASEEERSGLLNLVIVGAGPTGVELAGAFAEMKINILPKDYPQIDFSGLRIILVEGSANTLNNMSDHAKKASLGYLHDLGIEIHLSTVVKSYDGVVLVFKNGDQIPTKNVIWAAGVTGNFIPGLEKAQIIRNRYVVNRFNQIPEYPYAYALGDVAYMTTSKYPEAHPQVANVAINQARNLGRNLRKGNDFSKWKSFEYKDKGSLATIGKRRAVADLPFIKFHGRLAWLFWMFLHLMLILSVKNKIKIFITWSWHYFTNDSSLRLIFKSRRSNR